MERWCRYSEDELTILESRYDDTPNRFRYDTIVVLYLEVYDSTHLEWYLTVSISTWHPVQYTNVSSIKGRVGVLWCTKTFLSSAYLTVIELVYRTRLMFGNRLIFRNRRIFRKWIVFGVRLMFGNQLMFVTWAMFGNRFIFRTSIICRNRHMFGAQFQSTEFELVVDRVRGPAYIVLVLSCDEIRHAFIRRDS